MRSTLLLKDPDMVTQQDFWKATVKTARFILLKTKSACSGGEGIRSMRRRRNQRRCAKCEECKKLPFYTYYQQ
jgi:hypothetical protein